MTLRPYGSNAGRNDVARLHLERRESVCRAGGAVEVVEKKKNLLKLSKSFLKIVFSVLSFQVDLIIRLFCRIAEKKWGQESWDGEEAKTKCKKKIMSLSDASWFCNLCI